MNLPIHTGPCNFATPREAQTESCHKETSREILSTPITDNVCSNAEHSQRRSSDTPFPATCFALHSTFFFLNPKSFRSVTCVWRHTRCTNVSQYLNQGIRKLRTTTGRCLKPSHCRVSPSSQKPKAQDSRPNVDQILRRAQNNTAWCLSRGTGTNWWL